MDFRDLASIVALLIVAVACYAAGEIVGAVGSCFPEQSTPAVQRLVL